MSEHELEQMQHYEDKCAEEKYCSDNVPMICAFLNCDCNDCSKGKKEITRRKIEEYKTEVIKVYEKQNLLSPATFIATLDAMKYWLEEE